MRTMIVTLCGLFLAAPAQADTFCDTLLAMIHDAPDNTIPTATLPDRAGPQVVTRVPLPGARCLVSPYNPTGVKAGTARQSVYCFWSASEDGYQKVLDDTNARVAVCLDQTARDDTFAARMEYDSNYGVVRVSADQMTSDWAVSVTVMPNN